MTKISHRSSFGDVQKWTPPTFNEVPILDPGLVLKKGIPPGGVDFGPPFHGELPQKGVILDPKYPQKDHFGQKHGTVATSPNVFFGPQIRPPLLFDPNLDPPGGYPPYFWSKVQNDRIK